MDESEKRFSGDANVLGKVFLNASKQLGLTDFEIADFLGISIERLINSKKLEPKSKKGVKALYLIQVAQKLYSLTGGEPAIMKRFMHSYNIGTGGIPIQQISYRQELVLLVNYLNAISK